MAEEIDFTEWIKRDPENKFSISSEKVSWNHVDRTNSIEIYKDYNENFFKDFEHSFSAQLNEITNSKPTTRHMINFWALWNKGGNILSVYASQVRDSTDKWKIVFFQRKNGKNLWIYSGGHHYEMNKKYFFTIKRKAENCQIIVYEDAKRVNKIEDSGLKAGVADNYRFLTVTRGVNVKHESEDWSSGSIENLQITKLISDSGLHPVKFNMVPMRPALDEEKRSLEKKGKNGIRWYRIMEIAGILGIIFVVFDGFFFKYLGPDWFGILLSGSIASFLLGISISPGGYVLLTFMDAIEILEESPTDSETHKKAAKKLETAIKSLEELIGTSERDPIWHSKVNELEEEFIRKLKLRVLPALREGKLVPIIMGNQTIYPLEQIAGIFIKSDQMTIVNDLLETYEETVTIDKTDGFLMSLKNSELFKPSISLISAMGVMGLLYLIAILTKQSFYDLIAPVSLFFMVSMSIQAFLRKGVTEPTRAGD